MHTTSSDGCIIAYGY